MKKFRVSEYFRVVELDYMIDELEKELVKEQVNQLLNRIEKEPIRVSFLQAILIYSCLTLFVVSYLFVTLFFFEEFCYFLEIPILKPLILVLPAGILGLMNNKNT